MIIIVVFVIAVFIIYETLKGTGTAISAPVTPIGVSPQAPSATSDNGLSPIDIGGVSMGIPNNVLQWRGLAEKYAQINSILDPEEILAIIWNESTGNPNAENPGDPSWGLMGVTLPIGRAYAPESVVSSVDLLSPDNNVEAGSGYLAYLKGKYSGSYNDWPDAYNVGETKFNNGIRSANNGGYAQAFFSRLRALQGLG